ncbi:MAG TPA: IPT/TIG domain-containing protein, partial [Thermoanaerobaculia bacterium]|nr:IPT/TIG domain-containing protein [Thermoanaerobaculia bacterium]
FLLPALASAQFGTPPVITSITPPSGPPGTAVTIIGNHFDLPPGFACILPCPTTVRFNGIEVTPRESSDTRLLVIAPSHPAGPSIVTVITGDARLAFTTFTFEADQEGQYERALLPIYIDGRTTGVGGTQWQTDFWLRNNGGIGIALAPWTCPPDLACPAVFPLTRSLQSGESLHNLPSFNREPAENPGRILYYTKGAKLATGLRVADVSRQSLNAGTELPVVRNNELVSTTLQLLNVPTGPQFRHMLRIYDLTSSQTAYRVNLHKQVEGTAAGDLVATFELKATPAQNGPFRDQPSYAQAQLNAYFASNIGTPLRVEIVPETPDSRFWAFVSITNNDTQLVTLSTPQ